MKYWFDTEFIEAPCSIDLISIGIVAQDGRTLYMESNEVDWSRASQWVLDNVRPHLTDAAFSRAEIRDAILAFAPAADKPEFWGYFSEYDWVVFCWLFGDMSQFPQGYPMFCMDIKQEAMRMGNPRLPEHTGKAHNALDDAVWTRDAHLFLEELRAEIVAGRDA